MKITAVRHGETNENAKEIVQGQTFGTLSEKGLQQIEELGLKLQNEHFDVVYASDLERCQKTAEAIMQYHPTTRLIYDERLRERSLKPDEGRAFSELGWTHDEIHNLDIKTAEGESWKDVRTRLLSFANWLQLQPDQKVLLVTHGGPLRVLDSIFTDDPFEETIRRFYENCAIRTWEV